MATNINITQTNNNVVVTPNEKEVITSTTSQNIVVKDSGTETILVSSQGPQGPTGPQGPAGPTGSIDTSAFATTGSNRFIGDQTITGSLLVSGSSTFTNIGPAIFSGSVDVTGGLTGSITTASYAISSSLAEEASNNFDTIAYNNTTFNITAIRTNGGQQLAAITNVPTSSHSDTASFAGNLFGTPSIVVSNITASNISASGDITGHTGSFNYVSSSGTIEGNGFSSNGQPFAQFDSGEVTLGGGSQVPVNLTGTTITVGNAPTTFAGNVTASNNISASGNIIANNITASGDVTLSGSLSLPDGTTSYNYVGLGDADDLKILHNGNSSIITETNLASSLFIRSYNNVTLGDAGGSETMIKAISHGAVELYHNDVKKFETTADGIAITGSIDVTGHITASGNISASGQIIGDVVDTSFENFLNFEAATAFTYIAPFPLTVTFTGSSTSSMEIVGFVTASANTDTFSVQQTPPITLNRFDKLKITPSSSGLFTFSGSRTI